MATQTGSIDLAASNAVHLYAKAGFSNAEQTYATKSELEVTNEAVALRATKTEASQMAQPNLAPLFSMDHNSVYDATDNPSGYWRTKLDGNGFTQLDDGWTHFECDNINGSARINRYIRPARVPSIVPGNPYTILLEIRDNTPTGTGTLDIYLQQIANNQFWGNVAGEVIDSEHVTTTTAVNMASCGESYVRRSYRLADVEHLTDESGFLFTYIIRTDVGCKSSLDLRMSLYDGIYDGPYKPYSGNVLYATQSELKVTADGISIEVSKKVGNDEIISKINQSAESIQIQADKVEITGDAVFSAINNDTGTTKISGGKIDATSITIGGSSLATQADVDGIEVGGRNLALGTGELQTMTKPSDSSRVIKRYDLSGYAASVLGATSVQYISFDVKVSAGPHRIHPYAGIMVDGSAVTKSSVEGEYYATTEWTHVSAPMTLTDTPTWVQVTANSSTGSSGVTYELRNLKVETGTKPTDWTPAPEDQTAYVDSVQIGGRNLFKNSASLETGWSVESATVADGVATITRAASGICRIYQMPANGYWSWVAGETYTVSVEAKGDPEGCVLRLNPHTNTGAGYKDVTLTTEWARYSYTFTVTTAVTGSMGFNVYGTTGDVVQLRYPKLEHGTRATDWTPAPEDTDASIAVVQGNLNATRAWYATSSSAAGTVDKVATITPATTDFSLAVGTVVAVKFEYANSVAAPTLNVNGTGAKDIKRYGTTAPSTSAASSWNAGSVVTLTYDGTNWQINNWLNNNDYDRENYKVPLAASAAISAGRVAVVGSDGKLKLLSASAFDYTKPILYVANAYSATNVTDGTTRTSNYTFWGIAFTLTNTHSVTGAAAGKAVYIVGTISGTTFTPNSTVLTCTTPTSANGLVYLRLGIMTSTTAAVLESQHPMYMFHDGSFQQCDPATVASAKTATNYISADSNGIKIANANPATATTYQHLTATSTDFVVGGDNVLELDGTSGARIGVASGNHISIDSDSVDFMDGSDYLASIEAANIDGLGATTAIAFGGSDLETSVHGYRTASHRHVYIDSRHSYEDETTGDEKEATAGVDVSTWFDGRDDTHWASLVGLHGNILNLDAFSTYVQDPYADRVAANYATGGYNPNSIRIGDPQRLTANASTAISSASTLTKGASITVPPGKWIVTVLWTYNSNGTGNRWCRTGIFRGDTEQGYSTHSGDRSYTLRHFHHECMVLDSTTTLYAYGSSSVTSSAATNFIIAIRQH